MLKVADGAMSNTLDILSTMRERALAAANSTAKDSDRASIQKEFNQYIDQITDNSLVEYNGMSLMDGSHGGQSSMTTQAYTNKTFSADTAGDTKLTDLAYRHEVSGVFKVLPLASVPISLVLPILVSKISPIPAFWPA